MKDEWVLKKTEFKEQDGQFQSNFIKSLAHVIHHNLSLTHKYHTLTEQMADLFVDSEDVGRNR